MATNTSLLLSRASVIRSFQRAFLSRLTGAPWQVRRTKGTTPPADAEPSSKDQAPRCEAWTLARHGRPAHRCPNPGTYWRNGRRVCMAHKNARWVAFDKATAESLSRPR